jgi:hypothetical protein
MLSNKEKYRKLLENETSIPIFSRDWWMDTVCGEKNWNVLLVEKNNEIIASMPYYLHKKYGLRIVSQPLLTQTNGIWIKYPPVQKLSKKMSFEKEVMSEIIDQLEALKPDYYCQNFHYSIENWQPFYWSGYKQTTRYTFVIDDLTDLDKVFSGFSKVVRKNIVKASNEAKIYESTDVGSLFHLNELVFARQGLEVPYTLSFLQQLDDVCALNSSRKIFCAADESGKVHSMLYLIWDEESAYLLMSGTDPGIRDSNFKTLLVWEAIKYASEITRKFDFEGSMMENVAEYFMKFGAAPKPYHQIYKGNRRYKFLLSGNEMLKAILGKQEKGN